MSRRERLLQVQKSRGVTPEELKETEVPEEFLDLWILFWGSLFYGERITYTEMKAYCDLTGEQLSPYAISLLIDLSRIGTEEIINLQESRKPKPKK